MECDYFIQCTLGKIFRLQELFMSTEISIKDRHGYLMRLHSALKDFVVLCKRQLSTDPIVSTIHHLEEKLTAFFAMSDEDMISRLEEASTIAKIPTRKEDANDKMAIMLAQLTSGL